MDEFLKTFDSWICGLWNVLYIYVCKWTGEEVNEDLYLDTIFQ